MIRVCSSDDSEDTAYYAVFKPFVSEDETNTLFEALGYNTLPTYCTHAFDCCGAAYSGNGLIYRKTETRVLARITYTVNV